MRRIEADLRRIAATVRPGHAVSAVDPLDRGNRKRTTIVRFENASPVVIQRSSDRRAIETEAAVLRRLAETPVPVPAVLAAGETEGAAWLATAFVAGTDLHEAFLQLAAADRRRLVAAFGRWLGTVHELARFNRHGPVGVTDGRLTVAASTASADDAADPGWGPGPTTDGGAWLAAYGRRHVARLPADFDDLRPQLQDAIAATSAGEPRLFPWDLRPGNALVADGEVTAVLDWEAPLAADPAVAVATTEYLTADWYLPGEPTADLRDAFREGYRSVRPLPPVDPAHRVIAVASSAVDSAGVVTNPGYPPVDRAAAVAFHRRALERALADG